MLRTVYQSVKKNMTVLLLLLPAVLICLPVVLIITGSVMDSIELKQYLYPVFGGGEEFIRWKLMPDYPTFEHYGRLLFLTPAFFVLFWNSVRMVVCILIGQMIVGVPAAWASFSTVSQPVVEAGERSRKSTSFWTICWASAICWEASLLL